ncbi:MAG: hypothetical protein ACJ8MH_04055 [Povalibacter sp.]
MIGAIIWLAIVAGVSFAGIPQKLTPPGPQIVLLLLTISLLLLGRFNSSFRSWIASVDLRVLVGVHVVRALAGAGFLWAASHTSLSPGFATMAGYGDIIVAVLALAAILRISPDRSDAPLLYVIWNTLGLIDIMLVVATAARTAMNDPAAMRPLMQPPFALLPLFLVPIVIASHIWIFERLLKRVGIGR